MRIYRRDRSFGYTHGPPAGPCTGSPVLLRRSPAARSPFQPTNFREINQTVDRVYLDHAATTPLSEAVLEAMMPYLTDEYGNASSVHALGRRARHAVEESRERIAEALGAAPGEIVFTSGGTEADNAAIKGAAAALPEGRPGLLTSAAEHRAVLTPIQRLGDRGRPVEILRPDSRGCIDPAAVADRLDRRPEIGFVSLMYVNNELGTINPIPEIGRICRDRGVVFHCDAVQAPGWVPLRVEDLRVDLLSVSGHKLHGPKGIGVLYARGDLDLDPLIEGGGQERERRGGTENVPATVGMAEALERATPPSAEIVERVRRLRDRLLDHVRDGLPEGTFVVNTPIGRDAGRSDSALPAVSPHVLNLAFPPEDGTPVDGEMLLLNVDVQGVCASSGSACTSGALEPSHVLEAVGLDPETAAASLRFSFAETTTEEEIDRAGRTVVEVVERMRG